VVAPLLAYYWPRVRGELDDRYSEYKDSANDLRNRFRDRREDQSVSAIGIPGPPAAQHRQTTVEQAVAET
jgi:hypothetical protein